MYVKCGVYYGAESICDSQTTRPQGEYQGICDWNENMEFSIRVCDLPRSAKLCFVLYSSRDALNAPKGKKKKKAQKEVRVHSSNVNIEMKYLTLPIIILVQTIQIAWVNHAVFDYACNLHSGVFDVNMWPIYEELDDVLNYMGTTVLNSGGHGAVCLKVEVCRPKGISDTCTLPVMFPSKEISHRLADSVSRQRLPSVSSVGYQV